MTWKLFRQNLDYKIVLEIEWEQRDDKKTISVESTILRRTLQGHLRPTTKQAISWCYEQHNNVHKTEVYLEPSRTSKMEFFSKIFNSF